MRYLSTRALQDKFDPPRGRTSIARDIEAGRLPPPIKLGGRNYWIEEEVDAALAPQSAE